jgi:hypothetical protein
MMETIPAKMEIQEKRKKVQKPPPLLARARAPERMGCDELRRVKLAPPLADVTSPPTRYATR